MAHQQAADSKPLAADRPGRRRFESACARLAYLTLVAGVSACAAPHPAPEAAAPSIFENRGLALPPPPEAWPAAKAQSGRVVPDAAPTERKPWVRTGEPPGGAQLARAEDTAGPADITLNFANADVREVAQDVLGRILGLNYEIDPKVQGAVTLQTTQPIARSAVLPALESVLAQDGFALVHNGALYRVVPLASAARGAPIAGGPANLSGYGVESIPLRYASAAALKRILEPFVPTGGVLQADNDHNSLIVSGARADRESFMRLVATFDIDSMAGMSFGMYPLKQGDAVTVAKDLETILHSQGRLAPAVKVVPIERVNSVLLVSAQPKDIDRAHEWLERLDEGPDEASSQLYVYFAQNGRAIDLAKVLRQAFGSANASLLSTAPGTDMAKVAAPPGAPPVMGGPASAIGSASPPPAGATPPPGSAPPQPPAASDADTAAPAEETGQVGDNGAGPAQPPVHIVADDKNNALVIRCRPGDYRLIDAALKRLDVQPQQIMIEATVAEVTLNDNLTYGLQWFFQHGNFQANLAQGTSLPISQTFPGFNWVMGGSSAQVILSAISAVTDVHVVSAPQLMVLDHHTASIQVGDEVPIATQQAVSVQTPGAPVVNSIQLQDTGVILQVTPRINNNGTATLEIDQQVSQAQQTTTSSLNTPTISMRKISTEVAVADGQTIALGGMIQDQVTAGRNGIPVLSDVPVLGALFGTTTKQRQRTELLILLTPRIIHDQQEARDVTEELRRRLSPAELPPPPRPTVN